MSRLLEWASIGDVQQRRRSRVDPALGPSSTHTAEVRREEVRDFLKERNDVHQRRAKRREIAESTAVRLPREIQSGKVKRGGKAEVRLMPGPGLGECMVQLRASQDKKRWRAANYRVKGRGGIVRVKGSGSLDTADSP